MIKASSQSILHSLKGRIWLAVTALAVLNCICGLGSYLLVSILVADPLTTIFVAFFVMAFVTMVFGWWLSNEVTRPIESVTLIAKSLERSPSAALPRTTGSAETDELLQTLHRSGQQLQNLIRLMDEVAAGRTEAASIPLENGDKLSASFQKLVSKVTDSIRAKNDLDDLQKGLAAIAASASEIRNGRYDAEIRAENVETKPIADLIRFISGRLASLTRQTHIGAADGHRTTMEIRASIRSAIEECDRRVAGLGGHSARYDDHGKAEELASAISDLTKQAREVSERAAAAAGGSDGVIEAANQLRGGVEDTFKKIKRLRERSAAYTYLGRFAREIANRSNLIALNSAIVGDDASRSPVIAAETSSLSERAAALSREIASANESLNGEIAELENDFTLLAAGTPEIARLAHAMDHTGAAVTSLTTRLEAFESEIGAYLGDRSVQSDRLAGLVEKAADMSALMATLRDSDLSVQRLAGVFDQMRDSVADAHPSVANHTPSPATGNAFDGFEVASVQRFETIAEPAVEVPEN